MVGGCDVADLNVTYNYAKWFDFRALDGRVARDVAPLLRGFVEKHGTQRDPDYWKPTPGNVGAACARLLGWAECYPDARFDVD